MRMSNYATVNHYRMHYHGPFDGDDEELARLLTLASHQIDCITLGGAHKAQSEAQREALTYICCLQADFVDEKGVSPDELESLKVLDTSMKRRKPVNSEWFSAMGLALLRTYGLIERVVG